MTQRPYSTEDLRIQAALYLDEVDVNPLVVLVDMADQSPWCRLDTDDFNGAHSAVMAMINGTAIYQQLLAEQNKSQGEK